MVVMIAEQLSKSLLARTVLQANFFGCLIIVANAGNIWCFYFSLHRSGLSETFLVNQ